MKAMNAYRLRLGIVNTVRRHRLSTTSPATTKAEDYFELFQIPRSFSIDESLLRDRYRNLMKQEHPDVTTTSEDMASTVTHAYDTLKRPHHRATHLMELLGCPMDESAPVSPGFLMEMMELREKVASLKCQDQINTFLEEAATQIHATGKKLQNAIEAKELESAQQYTGELQYWNRLVESLRDQKEH